MPAPGAPNQPQDDDSSRPAFGAPPPGAPGSEVEPPPKKKKTWLWVLLGVFAFLVLLVGGCSFLLFRAATEPVDAAEDFMQLVSEGRGADAYDSLAPLCQTNNRAAFEQLVTDLNVSSFSVDPVPAEFSAESGSNARAVATGLVTMGTESGRLRLDLQDIEGDWRVCMFMIGGSVYNGS